MTKITVQLSREARAETLTKVLENAVEQFKDLEEVYVSLGCIHRRITVVKSVEKLHWFSSEWVNVPTTQEEIAVKTWEQEANGEAFLNVESKFPEYDDVAMWIAGQLESAYDKVAVLLCDMTKLGKAIGWRCAHCAQPNKAEDLKCERCGAPRGW